MGRTLLLSSALAVGVGLAAGWTMSGDASQTASAPSVEVSTTPNAVSPSGNARPSAAPSATTIPRRGTPTAASPAIEPDARATAAPHATYSSGPGGGSAPLPAPNGVPVYLTFDDGPDPITTPQILDLLAQYGARATFFVQGSQVQAHPELTRRLAAEGHSVQNHAWDHPRLTEMSQEAVVYAQLLPTNEVITEATGVTPSCLRAPFGATDSVLASTAASVGLEMVGWHIDPGDYNNPGASQIVGNVMPYLAPGSIVLLHDAGSGERQQTVDAVAALLPALAAGGFQPMALCQ